MDKQLEFDDSSKEGFSRIQDPRKIAEAILNTFNQMKSSEIIDQRQNKYNRFQLEQNGEVIWEPNLQDPIEFNKTYKSMISVHQSGQSCSGRVGNMALRLVMEELFGESRVFPEHRLISADSRRQIDLLVSLKKQYYFSITTTPRERKAGDWPHELDQLISLTKTRQISPNWRFIGFMYQSTKKEQEKFVRELSGTHPHATSVSASNLFSTAILIEEMLKHQ